MVQPPPVARAAIDDAIARASGQEKPTYVELLRVASMSVGVYVLPAGATDPQKPHIEDEVYFVLDGRGDLWTANDVVEARRGAVLYVAAGVPHRFERIRSELRLLVIFSPAKST